MWQTYNALFIIRNVCKYFVENLSEEVVLQQFDTQAPGAEGQLTSFLLFLLQTIHYMLSNVTELSISIAAM